LTAIQDFFDSGFPVPYVQRQKSTPIGGIRRKTDEDYSVKEHLALNTDFYWHGQVKQKHRRPASR
jgi:hypothetical protein